MKNILIITTIVAIFPLFILSCGTPRHYKAHLYSKAPKKSYKYTARPLGAVYHGVTEQTKMITVRLEEVYMGQIHREYYIDQERQRPKKPNAQSYSGKELWIIAYAVSADAKNPLLSGDIKYTAATSVKLDQESYSAIPISGKESPLFNLPADRDYRVTFKVYEVDKFHLKRTLYGAKDTDFAKLVISTFTNAVGTINNALFKSFINTAKKELNGELALEELILSAGSDLEFKGSFYLYAERPKHVEVPKHVKKSNKEDRRYALVDTIRSNYDYDGDYAYVSEENSNDSKFKIAPSGPKQYYDGLGEIREIQRAGITLNSHANYYYSNTNNSKSFPYQSYIKFNVSETGKD